MSGELKGRCAIVAVKVSGVGPITMRRCRSGEHTFFEVAWNNVERWLFMDQDEARVFYEVLVAKFMRRQRACAAGEGT